MRQALTILILLTLTSVCGSLTACSGYSKTERPEVATADNEQAQLLVIEAQLKKEGLDLDKPDEWSKTLASYSPTDLKDAKTLVERYLTYCQDVINASKLEGAHELDGAHANTRLETATSLLKSINTQLKKPD